MPLTLPVSRQGAALTVASLAAAIGILAVSAQADARSADPAAAATPTPTSTSPTDGSEGSVGSGDRSVAAGTLAIDAATRLDVATDVAAAGAQARVAGFTMTAPPQPGPAPTGQAPVGAQTATAAPVTSRLDVDGDGRADRTTLAVARAGEPSLLRLSARTAAGRTTSLVVRVADDAQVTQDPQAPPYQGPRSVWTGAGAVDGARGAEVVLDLDGSDVADRTQLTVYTMRGGTWRVLRAPGATNDRQGWHVGNHEHAKAGYAFSTRAGVRTVVATRLTRAGDVRARFAGTRTTYRWAPTGWTKAGTRRVAGLTATRASRLSGLQGLALR